MYGNCWACPGNTILISASHDLSLALNQKGAPNDFISKPFDINYQLNKVEQYVTGGLRNHSRWSHLTNN